MSAGVRRVTVTFDASGVVVPPLVSQRVLLALSASFAQFVRTVDATVARLFGAEFTATALELVPFGVVVPESFDAIRDGDALRCAIVLRSGYNAIGDDDDDEEQVDDFEFHQDSANVSTANAPRRFNAPAAARRAGLASPRGDEYQLRQFSSLRRHDRLSDERKRELLGGGAASARSPPVQSAASATASATTAAPARGGPDRSRGLSRSKSLDFEQDVLSLGLDDPTRPVDDAEFDEFIGSFSRAVVPAPKESLRATPRAVQQQQLQQRTRSRAGATASVTGAPPSKPPKSSNVVQVGAILKQLHEATSGTPAAAAAAAGASTRSPPSQRRMPMLDGIPAPPLIPQLARTVKGNDGPFSCPVCFKPYPTAADVQFHQTKRH
jgi:hypothetical protein